ncbi:MAG: hypothetical protein KAI16_03365 [Candidatus Pacebacteria bacterium]|nr:hypothetical protein [Candidatus Paceibacterota bacterium]
MNNGNNIYPEVVSTSLGENEIKMTMRIDKVGDFRLKFEHGSFLFSFFYKYFMWC